MINKLKKRIKFLIDRRLELIINEQRLNDQTHFNYSQLSQLFSEDSFIPFSAWSISPNTILHVLNDISINKRESIIEFGSGTSTFYIAKLLKVLKIDAVFYSIESDENWAREMQRLLGIYRLEQHVKIIYAPLKDTSKSLLYKGQKKWYSTNILHKKLEGTTHFDLVLVDGPFGGSTPYARYSAVPFLQEKLTSNCSIYLDDINRPHEKEIAKEWKSFLKSEISFIDRYALIKTEAHFDVTPFQLRSVIIK